MADDPIDPAADAEAVEDAVADAEATAVVEDAADAELSAAESEVVDEAEDLADAAADAEEAAEADADADAPKAKKPGALAVEKAAAPVVRRRVTSKRVTPKGTTPGTKATSSGRSQAARAASTIKDGDEEEESFSRPVPPRGNYAPLPSPWWVPAIMFGLLIIGALVIMLNYMGVFGDPENLRLVIGLAFILAGIIAATQYR